MPNWKKVIVSGSDAALNSVTTPNGTLNSFSASYALTASYALNGGTGGGGISAIYIADEGTVQGTASYFDFNGAGVTATVSNNTASITIAGGGGSGDINSANAILNQTVAAVTWSFDHNLGTQYPVFTIYDANDDVIIPQKIHTVTTSSALIYFSSARTGTAVASKGGTVVTASAATSASYALRATSASYAATATSASYADNSITSSYSLVATSASYAVNSTTASYSLVATSASFANNSISSSYALTASYSNTSTSASYAVNATTASYALTALSSSYTVTSSLSIEARNIVLPVKNVTGVQIDKGKVVRISGATGDNALISLADWTNDNSSANTIGFVMDDIPNDSFGKVMTEGTFLGYDTDTPGWTAGQLLYLGASGSITGSAPRAPLHGVRLGQVLRVQQNNGSIYVRIDNGIELGEAHDVIDSTTAGSYGDLLMKSGSVWTNSKQLTGSYGLTGSLQATSFTGSLLGTASYASFANTSSYAVNSTTASYSLVATSASYAANSTTSSYAVNATTASYAVNATTAQTASYADNFTVAGTLTAQTINVQTVSSSVVYSSGSNRFGNDLTNTQSITGSVSVTGSLAVNGSNVILSNQTSSMSVATASYVLNAVSASYATSALTSSYALTAPYSGLQGTVPTWNQDTTGTAATASYVQNAQTASYVQTAQTASYVLNAVSASYAANAAIAALSTVATSNTTNDSTLYPVFTNNIANASVQLKSHASGSFYYDGVAQQLVALSISSSFTGSLQGTATTASYVQNAQTASYVLQAVSSSFATNALTASYASNVPETASYALVALTASYAANVPLTASYALSANTASYALTASYISGSGAGVGFPFSGSAVITGSLFVSSSFISGSFTGSLQGTASYATFALSASNAPGFTTNKTQSTPAVTWSFVHNLNTRNPLIQVYDSNYNQIIPNAIIATDALTAEIRFDYSASGYAVASNGGGLYITGSTSRLDQTSAAVTWSFTHNLNTKYPAFEVYDSNDFVVIPSGIRVINENSAELYFAAPSTGKAIANFSGINGAPNATTASYSVTSEWNGLNSKPISSSLGTAAATSTTVVAQVATASYSAAFFDYAVISGSNSRAGTVMSVWNGGNIEYTDTSTSDIGNTNQVTMSVDLSGANVRLKSTTTDAWTVKSLIRLI